MNPVEQVNDCRLVMSAQPNAVNQLDEGVEACLPELARPLMPLIYVLFCESPYRPVKFNVIDMPDGREELFQRLIDNAVHSKEADVRFSGLWLDGLSEEAREDLAYTALNGLGCMYAWILHRIRCERLTASIAETHAIAQDLPHWPINHTNIEGRTVLHAAAMFARTKTVIHLIRHGADVHARDFEHRTPLHWICGDPSQEAHADCASALLQGGASANACDVYHRTPLHAAIAAMSPSLTRLLLAHGGDLTARDREGLRPIDLFVAFKPEAIADEMRAVLAEFDGRRLAQALSPASVAKKRRI